MSTTEIPEDIKEDDAELWRMDTEIALADITLMVGSIDWETATPDELRKQIDAEAAKVQRAYEALKAKLPSAKAT